MYKWPNKDKDETLDYSIDWSRVLGASNISSVEWYIAADSGVKTLFTASSTIDGLQFVAGTNLTKVSTARFSLGINNKQYTIICAITTPEGLRYERSVTLRIKEK